MLIGVGTIFYIISNNTKKNYHNISEKIHSLLVEIEYLFAKDNQLNSLNSDDISYALTKQANVFFADINLFDLDGQLYASSRTKIFEEGLIAKKMNPEAFYHLAIDKTTEYIHEEHIGDLSYLSAYVPMRNADNQVIGYLNLPYFAKQNELKREISTFVVAVINIYVLLIVLVLIAAIFLSNTVTEPLRLIQERLGNIQLGRKNEQIAWKGNDEIAELINEYNRMVSELAESAEKLARSERESAWREMAKQVAHEIKNPLTPMKLSTQLLKRAWDDKAPEFELRLERFTQALVEQIDTLSHIATEFSNFAQMPKMTNEKVDLVSLLEGESDFHAAMRENLEVRFINELNDEPHFVYSDKEQLMRVMNNLIRNAMQAIPSERAGLIILKLTGNENEFYIEVKDNGNGIEPEIQEKIFRPNFTTKQSGMGLGLALVKSIIESSKGTISFETSAGNGSSFFITLPRFNESNIS
jgi:nitrogen fixation/metabolism regulation signal transduction histidine kinase